jgi:hypothetical protein
MKVTPANTPCAQGPARLRHSERSPCRPVDRLCVQRATADASRSARYAHSGEDARDRVRLDRLDRALERMRHDDAIDSARAEASSAPTISWRRVHHHQAGRAQIDHSRTSRPIHGLSNRTSRFARVRKSMPPLHRSRPASRRFAT